MQAGIVTQENISQILRAISHKRRHGVLELHSGDRILEISFYQGKIVNLLDRGCPLARRVAQRLAVRETIFSHSWIEELASLSEFSQKLNECGEIISPELIALVVSQQTLEALYALELESGSFYNFRVEMVAAPGDSDLQLSVGQLLLDLVALKENHGTFARRFPEELVFGRGAPEEREYSLEEQDLIWLVDGQMTIAELRARSLLNRLTFDEVFISLVDSGVLVEDGAPVEITNGFDLSNLDASIESCVDRAIGDCAGSSETDGAASRNQSTGIKHSGTFSRWNSKCMQLNQSLLLNDLVPEVIVGIVCVSALVVPLLLW